MTVARGRLSGVGGRAGIGRFLLFALLLVLVGCGTTADDDVRGQILLWHSWDEEDTLVLDGLLDRYHETHPQARIVSVAIPPNDLIGRYRETASLGLGPDILLAPHTEIATLAAEGLIRPIEVDFSVPLLPPALNAMRALDENYGIPLSVSTVALYYNSDLVIEPAPTMSEWSRQIDTGTPVALNFDFYRAYWGITAFGEPLIYDSAQAIIEESGFVAWLDWLNSVQLLSNVYMSRDAATLRELFINGQVAYYPGTPEELPLIESAVEADNVRVAQLPSGSSGMSRSLLTVEALLFNAASTPQQAELAKAVATFLVTAEQSAVLLREAQRIPANIRVRVDPRLYPELASFASQARTATVLPAEVEALVLGDAGRTVYNNVLSGLIAPRDAVCTFATQLFDSDGSSACEAVPGS